MRVLATGRVGDGGAPVVGAEISDGDHASSVTRWVAHGTLVVLTDTAMTEGCPGRPDSEDALLRSAEVWMHTFGKDLPCVAFQIGFDAGGRPRAVLAVPGDGDGSGVAHGEWDGADDAVVVETLPCAVVTFTESYGDDGTAVEHDVEAELLRDVRHWIRANPDFACEAMHIAHAPTGRLQAVLVGGGLTTGTPPDRS
jgi:hypothetical protein